ncbi:MAG: DUF4364 family protein [Oscillospiraceae bacterium]|nr:DUF4364 family protein [Oscillospiraceae bacterium]
MQGNFGFIHEKIEIKILILYILRRLPKPVTLEALTGLVMCDDGFSYFDFIECVSELVKTEHVRFRDNKYSLTTKGERNGEITENNLPFSVRRKAENNAFATRNSISRDEMIKTMNTANPDGSYTAQMSLSDGLGEIVSLSLYCTNEKQALALEKGFRKNAERIYISLMEAILLQNNGRGNNDAR